MTLVADTPENESLCICGDCPTFPGEGILYCAKGAFPKPVRERGCICGDCKVYKNSGLKDAYYCVKGRAGEGPS
jgi:Protein of unknown function (DUF2769)